MIFDVCCHPTLLSTNFHSLTISVRNILEGVLNPPFIIVIIVFHILTNIIFRHVSSTNYHIFPYSIFQFLVDIECLSLHFEATYFHRVIDIWCMRSYFVYQTLNIKFCVALVDGVGVFEQAITSHEVKWVVIGKSSRAKQHLIKVCM